MAKQSTAVAQTAPAPSGRPSLMATFAGKFGVDAEKMSSTLKATAFRTGAKDPEVTNEQLMALVVVSNQFNLNPFLKEIYAFPDQKGGIIPVVGIDGWLRLINEHPQFEGMEIRFAETEPGEIPEWCEVQIDRKDRAKPAIVREYFSEVKRNTGPWGSHPRRMLRHKTIIQCGRVAFAFTGIHDPDEADRIREAIDVTPAGAKPKTAAPRAVATPPETIDQVDDDKDAGQQSLADANREPSDAELEEAGARG